MESEAEERGGDGDGCSGRRVEALLSALGLLLAGLLLALWLALTLSWLLWRLSAVVKLVLETGEPSAAPSRDTGVVRSA